MLTNDHTNYMKEEVQPFGNYKSMNFFLFKFPGCPWG